MQSLLSGQMLGESLNCIQSDIYYFACLIARCFKISVHFAGTSLEPKTCGVLAAGWLPLHARHEHWPTGTAPTTPRLLSLVALDRIIAWWRWFDGGQAPDLVNEDVDYILPPRVVRAARNRRFVKTSKGYIDLFPKATADGDRIYLLGWRRPSL